MARYGWHAFPGGWWLVALAAPFVTTLREMRRMRYLWRTPIELDERKLIARLGDTCCTPLPDALRTTLAGLGCLPGQRAYDASMA